MTVKCQLTCHSVRVWEVDYFRVLIQGLPDLLHVSVSYLHQELVSHRGRGRIWGRLKQGALKIVSDIFCVFIVSSTTFMRCLHALLGILEKIHPFLRCNTIGLARRYFLGNTIGNNKMINETMSWGTNICGMLGTESVPTGWRLLNFRLIGLSRDSLKVKNVILHFSLLQKSFKFTYTALREKFSHELDNRFTRLEEGI